MRFKGDFWKKVPLNNPENLIAETQVRFGIFLEIRFLWGSDLACGELKGAFLFRERKTP